MINRIHERALRIAYDDYISTFNELMVRWIEYMRGGHQGVVYDNYTSTFNERMVMINKNTWEGSKNSVWWLYFHF